MQIAGQTLIEQIEKNPSLQIKALLNDSDGLSAAFFSTRQEHRETKLLGLEYKENYEGNALAAMVKRDRVEIRYHKTFSLERVRRIVEKLKNHPDLRALSQAEFFYQGKKV